METGILVLVDLFPAILLGLKETQSREKVHS